LRKTSPPPQAPKPRAKEREPTHITTKPPLTLEIDFDYYDRYLKNYDLDEDQKRELITSMANIMLAFIDLGFGIAPGQIATEKPDQDSTDIDDLLTDFIGENARNLLDSDQYSKNLNDESAAIVCAAEGSES